LKWKYAAAWFPMLLIAIANGALRQFAYKGYLGELKAHQLSTVIAVLLFGIYIWFLVRRWQLTSASVPILIGLLWLAMTVLFEFVFGHFVMGHPWATLLQDYNIVEGRLWIFVLLWVTIAPYVFYRFQRRALEAAP
jgi:hypothetical protein